MENSYGIGIANRYDLFYGQDDVTEFETVVSKKKKEKKDPSAVTTTTTQPKSAEKENKAQPKTPATAATATTQPAKTGEVKKDQRKGIKEQNNTRKDNDTRQITQNGQPRQNFAQKPGSGGENREERNNRKNREMNGQLANGMDNGDKARNNNNGGPGGIKRDNNNKNRRNFNNDKRRDRQSGSDKTGVKSVDKRDGAGAHNWGTHKQDIEDLNKPVTDGEDTSGEKEGEENVEEQPAAPEEPKEMTLDEWKAQRQAQMLQPQYNLRKAGEGEDGGRWAENMKKLDRKVEDAALKKDDGKAKELEGKKKQVLDIEFHFNDGRRGGLGRRGPNPNGERGGERGERGPDRGGDRKQNRRRPPPRENGEERPATGGEGAAAAAAAGGGDGPQRRPQQQRRPRFQRGGPGGAPGGDPEGQNAPKVDDIRDFPSLG